MIRIKVEEEEEEVTPLSIESENDNQIKRLLSLKFSSNNNNNLNNVVGGSTTSDTNSGNFSGTLKEPSLKLPENNVVVPIKVVPKKKKNPKQKLDNFTTDSVAVGSRLIKTEPVESSLSLSTNSQLNQSLNFQSLLRQNRIQNGWTTNEQSIPIGTQQQQQSLLLPKIKPIVPENHQEIPLSLNQSFSIPNPNSGETKNCDTTTEISLLDQSLLIPNGTQQQQQQNSLLLTKIELIVPDNQEVPLSLDLSSLIPNFGETPNCDAMEVLLFLDQSSSNPDETQQQQQSLLSTTIEPIVPESQEVSISLDLSSLIPNSGETFKRESDRLRCYREKANLKPLDSEVIAEKRRRKLEYLRKWKQQRLANATPEQLEQKRLKEVESYRQRMEKETEEQRKRRLEQRRQYDRTVRKQRMETMTPEERDKKRDIKREYYCRSRDKKKNESLEESQIEESQSSMSSKSLEQQIPMSSTSIFSTSMNDLVQDNSTLRLSHRNYSSKNNNFIKKD